MWSHDERFEDLVKKAWNISVQGTPMFILVQKMKRVEQILKKLHRSDYVR